MINRKAKPMRSLWKIKHGVCIYTLGIHTYRPILYLIHWYYYLTLGLILTVFRNTWVPIHIPVARHVHNKKSVINLVSVWFLWRLYWDRECKEIKFRPCDTFHPMTLHQSKYTCTSILSNKIVMCTGYTCTSFYYNI